MTCESHAHPSGTAASARSTNLPRVAVAATVALAAACVAIPCRAGHTSIENGMPCVDEVCVGEPLDQVLGLPWLPVFVPSPASAASASKAAAPSTVLAKAATSSEGVVPPSLSTTPAAASAPALTASASAASVIGAAASAAAAVPSIVGPFAGPPAALATVSRYWPLGVFDATGLRALSRVEAVCEDLGVWHRPRAQLVSANGWITTVSFEPVVVDAGRAQDFRVATILQTPPAGETAEEIERFGEKTAERYAGIPRFPSVDVPGVRWRTESARGPTLKLFAPIGNALARSLELGRHPLCADD